ncbi:sodium/potassium/calcium exchanger 3-like isoform X2 [Galleria mellonella]|uniref:Sodium/potassium/calcium exchanger 3-like isoform X2 n=1 Tax=Galleria mellonella TaxID=7137 RepID=A0A6J1WVP0_GALME|nr:sodium/potassium/calcium exchanger 3-like isoform X2 [Galleria mellonella]
MYGHGSSVMYVTLMLLWVTGSGAVALYNVSEEPIYSSMVNKNGETVYISYELMSKLSLEQETWHLKPWLRTRIEVLDGVVREVSCIDATSSENFPDGIFNEDQLRKGAFLLYALFGIYTFTLLAIVCNDYFIPSVEFICEDLKIPQNVAAATFMSVATSFPEFFVNVISTFITESDMGIGTIIGSAIFNALGVGAIGGLAAVQSITIEPGPVTRDVIIYMVNVGVLVAFVWDGQIDWYEAVVLGILYVIYFVIMFNSLRMFALFGRLFGNCTKGATSSDIINDGGKPVEEGIDNKACNEASKTVDVSSIDKVLVVENDETELKPPKSIWRFPKEKTLFKKIWWIYTWPLKLILGVTIPSPIKYRKLYPLAFIMCIVWIGVNSYFVTWSMTVIGETFFIPESVMGMTFLAFGGCLPEACSIFIMSRRGEGGIGVSNALGANSLAILFALGLPWLIKTLVNIARGADETAILINSAGIDFIVGSLLVAVVCLWITLFFGKFKLRKSIGFALSVLYIIFITFAILVEMGVILDRGFEAC